MAIKKIPAAGPFEGIKDGYFVHTSGIVMRLQEGELVEEVKFFYTKDRDRRRAVNMRDKKGNNVIRYVDTAVLTAFNGWPGKEFRPVYINKNPADCSIDNLEWRLKNNLCLWNVLNDEEMMMYITKMNSLRTKEDGERMNVEVMAEFIKNSREFSKGEKGKRLRAEFFKKAFALSVPKITKNEVVSDEQMHIKY